jgi:Uma2 family endonuclease
MAAQARPQLTEEEYLAIELAAEYKSEFYRGEMFAMAGGSPRHALLGLAMGSELRARLKGSNCRVYSSDLRVRLAPSGFYAYPDVVVVCGALQFVPGTQDTITNPSVLIEVLSPSTEAHDRGFKSAQYRAVPSIKEYAFVWQGEARVEVYSRNADGEWGVFREFQGLNAVCRFPALGCEVPLADLYADVEF